MDLYAFLKTPKYKTIFILDNEFQCPSTITVENTYTVYAEGIVQ